ncbi:MoaA/NifB/PqqE/SkfB family radical SAM enzyme [Desulfobaculum xiamenense]|uniref:MoaA/NifB/PqqE/SkfB family radical SAM enzyme n=1 Tax=Desulfobaculum xiamenense TaxID=995050 RepID=A0A846QRV0_9BACT|nr:radical SAM/SPASM domain-containing protein [Desulfobaculum xiamenense]NJB69252.1 MoaA/NifB/PqqE/SkfB family radical SAM enzyme [Desulfobaculum xiamenense]
MAAPPASPFASIQAEPTSRCTLRCATCLRGNFPEQWVDADMPPRVLDALIDAAESCESMHLQGWGESLLRDDMPDIVRAVAKRGARPSLSTNGTHLSNKTARALVDAGLASMAVSLAGPDDATQTALRGRGTFSRALEALATFHAARHDRHPPLLVNLLVTPGTARAIPSILRQCARAGADRVVPTHMVHVCCDTQAALVAYDRPERHTWHWLAARVASWRHGIGFVPPPMRTEELPVCPRDPLHSLFIAADGTVSPCVYLCPPMTGPYPVRFGDSRTQASRLGFGNIATSPLAEIWDSAPYRAFRHAFERRLDIHDALTAGIGADFESAARLDHAVAAIAEAFATTHRPPDPCRHCAHLHGV